MAYTTIDNPADYFNTITYTGDGSSSRSITGVGFQPDWVWTKKRNGATGHRLVDSVRGVTKALFTNGNNVESTESNGLTAFASDGYTLGTDGNYNNSSDTYVSWNWLADNTSGSSNTDGSITSTVAANTTAGFSIVSYTGNATNGATVGHGLGVTPNWIIVKNREATENWRQFHHSLGNEFNINLSTTGAKEDSADMWNDTSPTSSVFTIGTNNGVNKSGDGLIAYCFAEKKGFSKFGSYTGNGDADGTFVYTGFKPAWIMRKNTSRTNEWTLIDNKRSPFNQTNETLVPNANDAEDGDFDIDILSNGFKCRTSESAHNHSGDNFIYMAFAENPFVTAGTKAAGTAR